MYFLRGGSKLSGCHLAATLTFWIHIATGMVLDRPFGAWKSPITSKSITAGAVRLGGIFLNGDDLLWLEGRPQEGGRNVLCRYDPSTGQGVDISPPQSNIRTRVHEYGGGAIANHKGAIYFSEFATQQLCRLEANGSAAPITPDDSRFRFADGRLDDSLSKLYCVREDHLKPEPINVLNEIVSVSLEDPNEGEMTTIAAGNDFYSAPRLSPDGTKLAYLTWDHPNMPWDATELRVVTIAPGSNPQSSTHELIAGGDGDTSIIQPLWHPITGELYYLSDASGFYNVYQAGNEASVLPMEYDLGGSAPGWSLGQQGFIFLADGRLVAPYKKDGRSVLLVADVSKPNSPSEEYSTKDGLPMQFGGVIANGNDLYFIGGSPFEASSIYRWNLETKGVAERLYCSSTLEFPESIISTPKQIEFPTTLGTAFAYYYPPKNAEYTCQTESAPPLLVKAHGGPTACTGTTFNAGIQFWTSRGFAVLDVDYGGSTGYGRDYRRRLRKSWGIVDIDDVCNGALHMVDKGLADGKKLCIDGGSAGGYTTLGALAFRDVFTAGCSLYGVGDLTALAGDTHKFESRYLDGLLGPYPEEEALYKKRSPINSVDTLSCPILLLQGDEDKIVPPNQAETMHAALLKKAIPCCLKIYKGEQHGFRKAENIEDALDSELAFYGRVYGIAVPDAIDIDVDGLPK